MTFRESVTKHIYWDTVFVVHCCPIMSAFMIFSSAFVQMSVLFILPPIESVALPCPYNNGKMSLTSN